MIAAKANIKEIKIIANMDVSYEEISKVLFSLLKYENLYDGRFYITENFLFDQTDISSIVLEEWLPYFKSKKAYTYICLCYDDDLEYKSLFEKWNGMCDDLGIVHQMYLYSCYSSDITPDVKLALLLQTFEPIADKLYDEGKLVLTKKPYVTKSKECDNCGFVVSVNVKNKELHFGDRIEAIIDKYGSGIFDRDNKSVLIEKAVNLRNKIVHLDCQQEDTLSGKESGVYLYKFSLLYRNIILDELGLNMSGYTDIIKNWINDFEKKYGHFMIR